MFLILVTIIIALFIAMLFVNVYFRVRVLKSYKVLIKNNVQFGAKHVFSDKKLKEEIYPKYPQHKEDIRTFVKNIRNTINMASILIALITLFGAVLMYYRYE